MTGPKDMWWHRMQPRGKKVRRESGCQVAPLSQSAKSQKQIQLYNPGVVQDCTIIMGIGLESRQPSFKLPTSQKRKVEGEIGAGNIFCDPGRYLTINGLSSSAEVSIVRSAFESEGEGDERVTNDGPKREDSKEREKRRGDMRNPRVMEGTRNLCGIMAIS